MNNINTSIIQGRMDKLTPELETSLMVSGRVVESLPLSLGDTSLSRELYTDGTRGDIEITTQQWDDLMGSSVTYRRYVLRDGQLLHADFGEEERPMGKIRRLHLLAKIAFSKVDHWDRETDFYGVDED